MAAGPSTRVEIENAKKRIFSEFSSQPLPSDFATPVASGGIGLVRAKDATESAYTWMDTMPNSGEWKVYWSIGRGMGLAIGQLWSHAGKGDSGPFSIWELKDTFQGLHRLSRIFSLALLQHLPNPKSTKTTAMKASMATVSDGTISAKFL